MSSSCWPTYTMHRSQLLDIHAALTDKAFRVMQKKNHDYASNTDPFFNLRQCEAFGLCSVERHREDGQADAHDAEHLGFVQGLEFSVQFSPSDFQFLSPV